MPRVLYREKLDLFRDLAEVSAEMAGYTGERFVQEDGAIENFQSLLQKRESIISQVDKLDQQISESRQDPSERETAVIGEIRILATQIIHYNETIEAVAKTALAQLRDETKKVQEGRQSHRAYDGRISPSEGAFIDKRR